MDKRIKRNQSAYILGSNAVQLEGNYSNYKRERVNRKAHIEEQKAVILESHSKAQTFILVLVILATLGVAIFLLKTQFIVMENSKNLIHLKNELVETKNHNDQLKSEIQKNMNLDEVYRIATEELGMVQAGKDNVRYISLNENSYTTQYGKVAVSQKNSGVNIGNILAFISQGW